jgi:signal peptidase I
MKERQDQGMRRVRQIYTVTQQILAWIVLYGIIAFLCLALISFGFSMVTSGKGTIFNYKPILIVSESMAPAIQKHAIVLGRPVQPDTLKEGDIISFRVIDEVDEDGLPLIREVLITHRITHVDPLGQTLMTKGDNSPADDSHKFAYSFPDSRLPFRYVDYEIVSVWNWVASVARLIQARPFLALALVLAIILAYILLKMLHNWLYEPSFRLILPFSKKPFTMSLDD